jgi:hypothetical protein
MRSKIAHAAVHVLGTRSSGGAAVPAAYAPAGASGHLTTLPSRLPLQRIDNQYLMTLEDAETCLECPQQFFRDSTSWPLHPCLPDKFTLAGDTSLAFDDVPIR